MDTERRELERRNALDPTDPGVRAALLHALARAGEPSPYQSLVDALQAVTLRRSFEPRSFEEHREQMRAFVLARMPVGGFGIPDLAEALIDLYAYQLSTAEALATGRHNLAVLDRLVGLPARIEATGWGEDATDG